MTIPVWPATVNYKPTRESWRCEQDSEAPLSSDMNAGTTRRRNKYTLRIAKMSFDIEGNATEQAAFWTFYRSTLGNGSARFTMTVWDGAQYVSRTVAFQKGTTPARRMLGFNIAAISLALEVESL